MSENPFEAIAKAYEESVKERDKAGYADKFKSCAELFFQRLNEESGIEDNPVHFEDIEYLDGYYIFGYGTNSVVHFHIKECPGWLFGIWWKIPEDQEPEQRMIAGEFFAQYEDAIDKFKPSASVICDEIKVDTDLGAAYCWDASKAVAFIRSEPYLAFCRDYHGWNYNEEYHTREEAKKEFDQYCERKHNREKYTPEFNEKVFAFVRKNVLPLFNDAKISDCGEGWFPRYEVVAPYQKNKHLVKEPGLYSWFDKDNEGEMALSQNLRSLIEECKSASKQYGFSWDRPFDECIEFVSDEEEI